MGHTELLTLIESGGGWVCIERAIPDALTGMCASCGEERNDDPSKAQHWYACSAVIERGEGSEILCERRLLYIRKKATRPSNRKNVGPPSLQLEEGETGAVAI